jgi:SAM-dependent methyltransferase
MKDETIQRLLDLNLAFYEDFGASFAATRRQLQPGVQRALGRIPNSGYWLDLGCGPGTLAAEWAKSGRQGLYLGLDSSTALLEEAGRAMREMPSAGLQVSFTGADLARPEWPEALAPHLPPNRMGFDGVLAFAVMHHLPAERLRLRVLRQVRSLLSPGGLFIHSEWQFQHSPRLMARVQPWEVVGVQPGDLEEGDTLLDWRHSLPGDPQVAGLRYVHLFSRSELACLAKQSGFEIIEEYESDGQGGRLALYQVWRKLA